MSKLYKSYINLKEQDSNYVYIFKSGMFYIFIDEDATSFRQAYEILEDVKLEIMEIYK